MHAHLYFARVARITPNSTNMCRFKKVFTAAVHGFFQTHNNEALPVAIALCELTDGSVIEIDTALYGIEFTGEVRQLVDISAARLHPIVLPPMEQFHA